MGKDSSIEWTHHTFNPWWGCTKISPGCKHCYAAALAQRWGHEVWGKDASRRSFEEERWRDPLAWNKVAEREQQRARVFCASMADVFEARADLDPWRARLSLRGVRLAEGAALPDAEEAANDLPVLAAERQVTAALGPNLVRP